MPGKTPVELHIVSDATGETATRLVAALEAQFPDQPFEEVRHPQVETVDDLHLAVDRAKGRPAVVVYTIVKPELRDAMRALCRQAKLHYCDILGPPLASIAKVSGMAAIEFAVKYDDGVGSGLRESDIVLVGVSRTSKTPLSMYLGYLGYKTANVPIVRGIEPPAELFDVDPAKIVGLTIDATRLVEIRQERVRQMRATKRAYAEIAEIYEELEQSSAIHRRLSCPVLDITELSIEETAARIVRLVMQRKAQVAS